MRAELASLSNPGCELCPLHEWTENVCIIGNPPSRRVKVDGESFTLAVVGEAPGGAELSSSSLFTGEASKLLWRELGELGFKREHFLITNAVKCAPIDPPTPAQLKTCVKEYLHAELEAVQPRYGLLLGNSALRGVVGRSGITKYNGQSFIIGDTTWVASVHPAAVLRNPKYLDMLRMALLSFRRVIKNEDGQPETEITIVNDKASLQVLLDDLEAHAGKIGALDIESWSEHPGHGSFPGGGLAWYDPTWVMTHLNITLEVGKSYVVPLFNKYARWKNPRQIIDILQPYIEDVKWVFQNGQYDCACLEYNYGWNIRPYADSMGMAYAIDENAIKGLGFLATLHLQAPEYKDMVNKAHMNEAPLEGAAEYGGRDTDYCLRLYHIFERRMRRTLEGRLYSTLLQRAANTLTSVSVRGLPVHRGKLRTRLVMCQENAEAQIEIIHDIAGRAVNPNSPKQLAEVLFNEMELPVIERTKSGAASTAEKVLVVLQDYDDSGIIDALLEYRKWNGHIGKLTAWQELMGPDGRLHPNFKPFHTVTGRLSADNPNVQQIPRDPFIRGIIGGKKGWSFVEVDYSQIELRLAAHYTGDPTMNRIFLTGRDPHMEMAMVLTGKPEDEVTSEERKGAKGVNFGFLYGMGAAKYVEYAKTTYGLTVSEEEAQHARKVFFQTYKKLQPWHERQRTVARDRGWVVSGIGRKRRLHDIRSGDRAVRSEAERQAINSPVQSLASDMMLTAMIILEEALDPNVARIVSTVHDAILFEIRDEAVDDVLPFIVETMENLPLEEWYDLELRVPVEAEAKVGRFWSEGAKVWHP